jgi:signal peptidase I
MNKPVSIVPKVETKSARSDGKSADGEKTSLAYTIRETIESIVIAFVLAFLFRTFEAEAFVIPTGSMAPTLQGRHKDVVCPNCSYAYRASASNEVNDAGQLIAGNTVMRTTCPICRYRKNIDSHDDPSYNGDRILVGKFPYDFSEPKRWDVIVFKFPGDAKMNYIKRLVGLPGEKLGIWHGDLFLDDGQQQAVDILRKPPDKVRAMAQIVYDNDYVVDEMTKLGWPLRWQPWSSPAGDQGGWTTNDGGRSYSIEPTAQAQWIRYQHLPPSASDWKSLGGGVTPAKIRPQLITDFYAYNTNLGNVDTDEDPPNLSGMHWVGDLMLQCEVEVAGESGVVTLDLVRGGVHFLCTIDVATGEAKLTIPGFPAAQNSGKTPVGPSKLKGPGKYEIVFANFDHRLLLWVAGKLVEFDAPTDYDVDTDNPRSTPQDAGDLAPVGIAAEGVGMTVEHLKVLRDIYYIAQDLQSQPMNDFLESRQFDHSKLRELLLNRERQKEVLSDPSQWSLFDPNNLRSVEFNLEQDQFFVLGDNSPFSKDARLWGEAEPYVKRELLIGKALYIYWPHSFDRVPGTKVPLPFFPNFGAMGFVR